MGGGEGRGERREGRGKRGGGKGRGRGRTFVLQNTGDWAGCQINGKNTMRFLLVP